MNYTSDTGFAINSDSEYYMHQDLYYPLGGSVDSSCVGNQDCQNGLSCQTDPKNGWQSCQLPPKLEEKCHRGHNDPRCHFITDKGNTVLCQDKYCAPKAEEVLPHVDPIKCARSQLYHHYDSGASFCGMINQNSGQFEQQPEKCCHSTRNHMYDMPPDYMKLSLGPQYLGVSKK
jgi:hypothetical protein